MACLVKQTPMPEVVVSSRTTGGLSFQIMAWTNWTMVSKPAGLDAVLAQRTAVLKQTSDLFYEHQPPLMA